MTMKIRHFAEDAAAGSKIDWNYDFAKDAGRIVPLPDSFGRFSGFGSWTKPNSHSTEILRSYGYDTHLEAPKYLIVSGQIVLRRTIVEQNYNEQSGRYDTHFEQHLDADLTAISKINYGRLEYDPLYSVTFDGGRTLREISNKTLGQLISDNAKIYGNVGDDKLKMTNASEKVYGGFGNDTLIGRGGDDVLSGDSGMDKLKGGAGADMFLYRSVHHSTPKSRDIIYDFSQSDGDVINLKAIDAKAKTSKNDKFKFIGEKVFTGNAGEMRFETVKKSTYVYADTNGDGKADFSIMLKGAFALEVSDFLL